MAKFIVSTFEIGKYPTLEAELSPFCEEVIYSTGKIVFVPRQGYVAKVGLTLLDNNIAYDLDLDENTSR